MPRRHLQSDAPQLPLRTSEQLKAPFRSSERGADALSQSEQIAAELLRAAFKRARLNDKEIAHLCGVSRSLVEKWSSTEQRGCPSFVQLLLLPPSFHYALHKEMNARFGFGKQALRDLMDAAGSLAMVIE